MYGHMPTQDEDIKTSVGVLPTFLWGGVHVGNLFLTPKYYVAV